MDLITTATSRRALLGAAGATGVTLAAGATVAAAATTPALPTIEVGNYSFPALPKAPNGADLLALTFLDSVMLAAETLYDMAKIPGEMSAPVLETFRNNHRTQAEIFKSLAGTEATKVPNRAIVAEYADAVGSQNAVSTLAEVTDRLIATLLDQLAQVEGTNVTEQIAGALSTCSRQRLVLGQLLGEDTATILPTVESTENPFTPDAYPAERV